MTGTQARLRAVLGATELDHAVGPAAAWADGYGIVAPEVARYGEVLRGGPDAVLLAMRNVAAVEGLELLDAESATLIGVLARSLHPRRVLEVGTGLGLVTLTIARAVPDDCTVTSLERDPMRQGQAHAFLEHDELGCATELRLGDPVRLLREAPMREGWDLVVLTDPSLARLEIVDAVTEYMSRDALLVVPFALRGGRVAHGTPAWDEAGEVDEQRTLNRCIASDVRFTDVAMLPVGDGLLIARRV